MQWGPFGVWLGVTIGVPVFLPILVMGLACWMLKNPALHPFQILKDGQLLWFAIALASAGIAEAVQTEVTLHAGENIILAGGLLLLLTPSLFVLGCAATSPPQVLPQGSTWAMLRGSTLLMGSFGITFIVILACAIVHARLPSS